jgi:predicted O-methyltransferase YrrM
VIRHLYHHPTNDGPWDLGTGGVPNHCYYNVGERGHYYPCGESAARHDTLAQAIDEAFDRGMYQHRGEIEPFAAWLIHDVKPRNVVEIGAWKGGTALLWSRIALEKVVSVDLPMGPFGGATAHLDIAACEKRNSEIAERCPNFVGILGNSQEPKTLGAAARALDGKLVDLLFIDGDHTYEGVKRDFEAWSQIVKPGGWVAFHDIADTPRHTRDGVEVRKLWLELQGEKKEWRVDGDFGGIGAVRV